MSERGCPEVAGLQSSYGSLYTLTAEAYNAAGDSFIEARSIRRSHINRLIALSRSVTLLIEERAKICAY
jgi:hypothetical protein